MNALVGVVTFFMVMQVPGHPPIQYSHETANMAECLFEVHEFLVKPSHEVLIRGGILQVGCQRQFGPSEEH